VALLLLLIGLGAPSVLGIDWMRDKLGKPTGLTVENLVKNPDLQLAAQLIAGVAATVIPNGSILDDSITGFGQGSFNLANTSVILGGAMDIWRSIATIASTAVWNDPSSWKDALSYSMSNLAMRRLPMMGNIVGMQDEGWREYLEAGRSVKRLAPSDVERSPMGIGRIPTSPAYDNVRRAIQMATAANKLERDGNLEEAQAQMAKARAEAEEGMRQLVASGVDPDAARKKVQAALGAQSPFRGGFERALTEEEKLKVIERATPKQRESILNREAASRELSAMFGKGRSSFAGGQGRPIKIASVQKLAARRRLSQRLAATSPSKQLSRPIQIRSRRRSVRSRDRLARLARLRKQAGLAL
jgi:hypothetical protein